MHFGSFITLRRGISVRLVQYCMSSSSSSVTADLRPSMSSARGVAPPVC